MNDLPPHIASYLEGYSLWVAQARARGVQYTAHNTQYTTAIQPLLRGIVWNQGYPYNLFTPEIDGNHALVGCVATATAQIMRYFSWPPRGEGTVEGYPEFGSKQYDWENMPDDARYASRIEQEAVAHLSNEVGRAAKMRYGVAGSSAYIQDAYSALLTHFDYASSLQILHRTSYADEAWQQLLLDELTARRPVFYCGSDRENENAHAFVLDGYNRDGYYHVNWGWGGACNGYFLLSQLKPDAHNDFSYDQWAIVGFCPSNELNGYYELSVTSSGNGNVDVLPSKGEVRQETEVKFLVTPAEGYSLKRVKVFKTEDATTEFPFTTEDAKNYSFQMPACPVTICVEFEKTPTYQLTVAPTENGNVFVWPEGSELEENTMVSLFLTPSDNCHLSTLKVVKTDDPTTEVSIGEMVDRYFFYMPAYPVTVRVEFTPNKLKYPLTLEQEGRGVLDATPFGKVLEGTQVELTVTPSEGHHLGRIKVYKTGDPSTELALTGDGAKYTFLMPAYPVTVRVEFEKDEKPQPPISGRYQLTLAPSEHGSVSASPSGEVESWTWVSLTVTPESGYHLANLKLFKTGDEATVVGYFSGSGQYSFQMPTHPLTVKAEFEIGDQPPQPQKAYHLSFESYEHGTLAASHVGDIPEFSIVTVTATPDEGYHLANFYVCLTERLNARLLGVRQQGDQYTFLMGCDLTAYATFEADAKPPVPELEHYSIEVTPSLHGNIFIYSVSQKVNEQIAIEVEPEDGYEFLRLELFKKGELERKMLFESKDMIPLVTARKEGFVFNMPAYDVTIRATFVPKNNSGTPVYESPNLEVTCSPNPCRDFLRLENRGGEPLSYRVFSVAGALLHAGELPTGECIIDLSSLPEGLYLVHCTTPFGSQKTFKVVKQ